MPEKPGDPPPSVVQSADVSANLASEALDNLVNQFARPMDFLRELVQNSIDAGTPRVEVTLRFVPPGQPGSDDGRGVLQICVDDHGEGMDEGIIDGQLTRMFSSNKEDDLTKIGKFGIGFTSIFAIRPDAVLLRTGRHGEFWELLFHPDRSFDKVRIAEPVNGTQITLYKRMRPDEVDHFVSESRWILTHWCRHSDTPITFWDQTRDAATGPEVSDDPFAAFEDSAPAQTSTGPEQINGPLSLDGDLVLRMQVESIEVLVAYADRPRFGFFNGGLTLLDTDNLGALGRFAPRHGHLQFKIKSNALEHTLTRDNVLQDEHWEAAMAALGRAHFALRDSLVDAVAEAAREAAAGRDRSRYERLLGRMATEAHLTRARAEVARFTERVAVLDRTGQVRTLTAVEAQEDRVGAVLLDPGPSPLAAAVEQEGLFLLPDGPDIRTLLASSAPERWMLLFSRPRHVRRADELFLLPRLRDPGALPPLERALLQAVADLLHAASGGRIETRVGDFEGPGDASDDALAFDGPDGGRLFQRPTETWFRVPEFLRRRCLLINRHHPTWRAWLVASAEAPEVAAVAVAQALLHGEGIDQPKTWERLLDSAEDLVLHVPAK